MSQSINLENGERPVVILTRDDLVYMQDYELHNQFSRVSSLLGSHESALSEEVQRALETEFCYLFREVKVREARARAAQEYEKSLQS